MPREFMIEIIWVIRKFTPSKFSRILEVYMFLHVCTCFGLQKREHATVLAQAFFVILRDIFVPLLPLFFDKSWRPCDVKIFQIVFFVLTAAIIFKGTSVIGDIFIQLQLLKYPSRILPSRDLISCLWCERAKFLSLLAINYTVVWICLLD